MIAGGFGGCVGKTVTAPLSRITILYQVGVVPAGANSFSIIQAMLGIVRREGVTSMWKGNLTAVIHR